MKTETLEIILKNTIVPGTIIALIGISSFIGIKGKEIYKISQGPHIGTIPCENLEVASEANKTFVKLVKQENGSAEDKYNRVFEKVEQYANQDGNPVLSQVECERFIKYK